MRYALLAALITAPALAGDLPKEADAIAMRMAMAWQCIPVIGPEPYEQTKEEAEAILPPAMFREVAAYVEGEQQDPEGTLSAPTCNLMLGSTRPSP